MGTNDCVSYDLALKLKECGFDEPCEQYKIAIPGTLHEVWDEEEQRYYLDEEFEYYPKATLWQAQKWLREKKGIVVVAEPDWDEENYCMADYLTGKWYFTVWKDGNRVRCNFNPNSDVEEIWIFDKYEAALSAGISAALQLIVGKSLFSPTT